MKTTDEERRVAGCEMPGGIAATAHAEFGSCPLCAGVRRYGDSRVGVALRELEKYIDVGDFEASWLVEHALEGDLEEAVKKEGGR